MVARSLLFCVLMGCGVAVAQTPQPDTFWGRWEARASATQAAQPHWITPLVLVTPRLEQEFRTDFVHQYNTKGEPQWTYDNGKGLEMIPERHTEILVNLPPFIDHGNGAKDGFGDIAFVAKERIFSRNEEHGDAIVTFFFGGTIPTGKNGNGGCCAVVTPTLAVGKGFGQLALESTAGGSLPVTNAKGLGHTIAWNNAIQYRAAKRGVGRLFWPEMEFNSSFYEGGANNGKVATFATPGLVVGRVPLTHAANGEPGRLGLTFGAGEQIALTHFRTYNHATVITMRVPF